jgi:major type 1 subunit fimbrin (pilin)
MFNLKIWMHIVMNKKLASMLATASLLMLSAGAHAADGTISFTGTLQGTTCTTAVAGTSGTVALARVNTSSLAAVNARSGRTSFSIALSGCSGVNNVTASFVGANIDTNSGRLRDTGANAGRVSIAVMDASSGRDIKLGTDISSPVAISGGTASIPFLAEYNADAVGAVAGAVSSTVAYELSYQ